MARSYNALFEFGYTFLGPILSNYCKAVIKRCQTHRPVCLAREGWLIHEALLSLEQNQLVRFTYKPVYLKVSRTLLFRCTLGDPESIKLALSSNFRGTVLELFTKRFGLQLHEVFAVLPSSLLAEAIVLPNDAPKLEVLVWPYLDKLAALVKPSRSALVKYFSREGLTSNYPRPMMLDLGYAGTIQKLITGLIKTDTDGLYFVTTNPGTHKINGHHCGMDAVFLKNIKWNEGHNLLDRSLLLESLLTAPHGQVVDIRESSSGDIDFYYGKRAATQRFAQDLNSVFEGALQNVLESFRLGLDYTNAEVIDMYEVFVTAPGAIPESVRHLFALDDDFSGNGTVSAIDLFSLR